MRSIPAVLFVLCLALAFGQSAAAEGHAGSMPGGPVYVRLKSLSFSVIGPDNKIDKEVSILLDLELEPNKLEPMLDPFRRKMLDAFLVTLNEIYSERKPGDPPVGGEELKDRLMKAAEEITGPGFIHDVLIMSIGERGHSR
jgi:hypothetical protein